MTWADAIAIADIQNPQTDMWISVYLDYHK